MVDPSIKFCSTIMRCDSINHSAYPSLPDNVTCGIISDESNILQNRSLQI